MTRPVHTNRLIHEKSPYLLQHAHNPVDWYPWSEEAFLAAREQDKPIFLSIGYATCHWCHVMEGESFENVEVAQLMNETFINIKVDREEKPEVDSLYMEFAQAMMSGGAGWPLNCILTPDLQPFFATTYLPPVGVRGFLGMKQLALRIRQIWHDPEEREAVIEQAGKIVDLFASHIHAAGTDLPSKEMITEATDILFKTADTIYGGTKGAPKFPIGFQGAFLLRQARATQDSRALFYVEKTLEMMYRGGIYDHLGGGFSRYSVDERWFIPHFEKMLYDNAILIRVYLEAWQFTRQNFYREVAEETLQYIERLMTSSEGGFFSAEDADSEGHEGYFYTWTWNELQQALGPDALLFAEFFGCSPTGNFEGRNILHMKEGIAEFATRHRLDIAGWSNKLKELKQKLFAIRKQRVHPLIDDKILTAWNGLMIQAAAASGQAFGQSKYIDMAEKGARFIKEHLWKEGNLYRRYRDGEVKNTACLDDYACLICGLLTLFEADRGSEFLEWAVELAARLESDFKAPGGAYYISDGKDPNLLLRRCEFYDGAEPSGNAVHGENLIRLYQITGKASYLASAREILQAAKQHIDLYPPGGCYHLMVLQRFLDDEAPTLIIALNEEESFREEIAKILSAYFIPHKAVIWKRPSDEVLRDLSEVARFAETKNGKTTLYVCHKNRCDAPITELPKMWEIFEKM